MVKSKVKIACEDCGKKVLPSNLERHKKSETHKKRVKKNQQEISTFITPPCNELDELKKQLKEKEELMSKLQQECLMLNTRINKIENIDNCFIENEDKNNLLLNDISFNHLENHVNEKCQCQDENDPTCNLISDLMKINVIPNKDMKTQDKSNKHEKKVEDILRKHGFTELSFNNTENTMSLNKKQTKYLKFIIRDIENFNENHIGKKYDNLLENIKQGLYFIHQPLGSQMPPDFLLLRVYSNGDTTILPLECKSGSHIMWNDSLPKKNYVYLSTDIKKNKTSMFTGDEDCMVHLCGKKIFSDLHEIDIHTWYLRDKNKYLSKHEKNYISMKSFPRSNFSSDNIPLFLRTKVLIYVYKKFKFFLT